MIGETLTLLLNSTAILLQKGAALTGEIIHNAVRDNAVCGAMLRAACGLLPGLLCMLPGALCGIGRGLCGYFFGGQEIMTCLPEPFSKFIEPFLSCSLFESCPTL